MAGTRYLLPININIFVVIIRNVIITMASPSSLSLCHFKVQQHLHCFSLASWVTSFSCKGFHLSLPFNRCFRPLHQCLLLPGTRNTHTRAHLGHLIRFINAMLTFQPHLAGKNIYYISPFCTNGHGLQLGWPSLVQVSGETDMRMLTLERFTIYRVLQSLNTFMILK